MKKVIVVVMISVLIFLLAVIAVRTITNTDDTGLSPVEISAKEAEKYDIYDLKLKDALLLYNCENEKEFILAMCILTDSYTTEYDHVVKEYTAGNSILEYIPLCEEILGVCTINKTLYLMYKTTDGMEITVSYNDDGFLSRMIYDRKTDTAIEETGEHTKLYRQLRNGHNGLLNWLA